MTPDTLLLPTLLPSRAADWRWSSLWRWLQSTELAPKLLPKWPLSRLLNWVQRVNEALSDKELEAAGLSAQRGRPLGDDGWIEAFWACQRPRNSWETSSTRPSLAYRSPTVGGDWTIGTSTTILIRRKFRCRAYAARISPKSAITVHHPSCVRRESRIRFPRRSLSFLCSVLR